MVFEVFTITILTFLAQAVLTLRSVFLGGDGFVLTMAEWNRIYAITHKSWITTSCFGVITISQFILGLYLTVDTAERRCKSVDRFSHDSCLLHCFSTADFTGPASDLYDVHLRGAIVYGNRIYHHCPRIRYGTSLALHWSSRRHLLRSSPRLSSVLGHRLSRGTVQRNQGPDTQSIEDCNTRCDVLFPGHIHLTSPGSDVSLVRKRKHIVAIYHPLSHTFVGSNQTTPCPVSDTRSAVPFVRSPDLFPHDSGNFVYVRTPLCFPKHRV